MTQGLAKTSQQRAFNRKGRYHFWVLQINDKRSKERRKEAFLRIFPLASSSAKTRTFFYEPRVLDASGLAVTLESGTITKHLSCCMSGKFFWLVTSIHHQTYAIQIVCAATMTMAFHTWPLVNGQGNTLTSPPHLAACVHLCGGWDCVSVLNASQRGKLNDFLCLLGTHHIGAPCHWEHFQLCESLHVLLGFFLAHHVCGSTSSI